MSLRGAEGDEAISTTYIGSLFETQKTEDGSQTTEKITKHIFAGSTKVCSIERDNREPSAENQRFYHSDHLGSSNVITDETGNQVSHYEYTPYGSLAVQEPLTDNRAPNYLFTGKELDSSGLYYYGARYYDPEIARFVSADTIIQAPYDPQSLNRYAYCRDNPLKYTDPSGHFFFLALVYVAICAAIGAVANVAIAGISGQLTSWTAVWAAMGSGAVAGAVAGIGSFIPGAGTILGGALIGAVAGGAAGAVGSSISGAFSWGAVGIGAAFGGVLGGVGNSSVGKAIGGAIGKGIGKLPFGQHIQNFGRSIGNKLGQLHAQARGINIQVKAVDPSSEDFLNTPTEADYPPNRGFMGESKRMTLEPGTMVDKYGSPSGTYVSPQGTPVSARSLPHGVENRPLNTYQVVKPLEVDAGSVAPYYNQPGRGTQYVLDRSVQELVDDGYLKQVE